MLLNTLVHTNLKQNAITYYIVVSLLDTEICWIKNSSFLGLRLLGILLILLPDFKLQLVDAKRVAGAGPYELQGEERLGTSLIISPIDKNGPDLSKCNIQWHRVSVDGAKGGPVTGVFCV